MFITTKGTLKTEAVCDLFLQLVLSFLKAIGREIMARRVELQGIANALNGSFVSRNNDYRGYWTIGQLTLLAHNNNLTKIVFFLTPFKTDTCSGLSDYIGRRYAGMLGHLLRRQKIPDNWIGEASITIEFNLKDKHEQWHESSTEGDPFQCSCQIIDDTNRCYSSVVYGRSRPHSSANEFKSTRKLTI